MSEINKSYDGCHNCKYQMFDFCEKTLEHIDMFFTDCTGESMCDFEHYEREEF